MDVCVTGASGFIGRCLLDSLGDSADWGVLRRLPGRDYSDTHSREMLRDCRSVVYLAGVNRGSRSEVLEGNTWPLFSLLRTVSDVGRCPTVIYASSLQVYGYDHCRVTHSESEVPSPVNEYGASKLMAELILANFAVRKSIRSVILRLGNVYGPFCKPHYNSVIATYLDCTRSGSPIVISGDGRQERDFIFVGDVVESILQVIRYSRMTDSDFEIFNICTGNPVSVRTLASIVMKACERVTEVVYEPTSRETDFLIGDPQKASKLLGFNANHDIEKGIRLTCSEDGDELG